MARCTKDARSFVRDTFSPVVGLLTSADAESLCRKNNLSCVELFQPFSRLSSEVHVRDSNSTAHSLSDLRISMKDARALPVPPVIAQQQLSAVVANICSDRRDKTVTINDYDVSYNSTTPWYEAYRERFIELIPPSHHEYLNHFCAAVFVVSSSHPSPVNEFARLTVEQQQMQHNARDRHPSRWFCADILRYYILLHDVVEGEEAKAEAVYQGLKAKYGVFNSHLLKLNSVSAGLESPRVNIPNPWSHFMRKQNVAAEEEEEEESQTSKPAHPDVGNNVDSHNDHPLHVSPPPAGKKSNVPVTHGVCLSSSDHDNIKIFIHEFVVRAFVPWAERQIKSLSDLYQMKRGNKSIFNRLFRNRPAEKTLSGDIMIYEQDSSEMQIRRLADLAFMTQMYELAYQMYHTLKKDFESDRAFLYCAGVQEMASMAILMQGSKAQRQYPAHYLEGALAAYKGFCKSPAFATRAVLLSTEAMKNKFLWRQAALQFMGSVEEDSDLKSALMFEQAAYCYLQMKVPLARKFAFYLCLAGHRYVRAHQKRHGLRCYRTAMQIYSGREWNVAENHMTFLMGRLALSLGQVDEAMSLVSTLFSLSDQPPHHHLAYVREYIALAQRLQGVEAEQLQSLVLPKVIENSMEVCLSDQKDVQLDALRGDQWEDMEKACIVSAGKSVSFNFTPSTQLYNQTTKNTIGPHVVIGEVVLVTLLVSNTVSIPLILSNAYLLWEHQDSEKSSSTSNSSSEEASADSVVKSTSLDHIVLPPHQSFKICFSLVPLKVGLLKVRSMVYELRDGTVSVTQESQSDRSISIRGKQDLVVKRPRLNATHAQRNSVVYGVDNRLSFKLVPPMPILKVQFEYTTSESFPTSLRCGETKRVRVKLTNLGRVSMKNVFMSSNVSELCYIEPSTSDGDISKKDSHSHRSSSAETPEFIELTSESGNPVVGPRASTFRVALAETELAPSATHSMDLWLRGPAVPCESQPIEFLFYHESCGETTPSYRHRCSKHSFHIAVQESVQLQTAVIRQTCGLPSKALSHLLSLSVKNAAPVSEGTMVEYEITHAVCASPYWTALSLAPSLSTKVNSGEVALFCLKALPHPEKDPPKHSLRLSFTAFTPVSYISSTPCLSLFTNALKAIAPSSPEDSTPAVDHRHFMAILWKALIIDSAGETSQIQGQSHVELSLPSLHTELDLSSRWRTMARKEVSEVAGRLVDYTLQYTSLVSHPFQSSRLCHVAVTVSVTNTTSHPVHVLVSGGGSNLTGKTRFTWTGPCNVWFVLLPWEATQRRLRATFQESGTYNLDSLSVKAGLSKDSLTTQTSEAQRLATITDSS